MFRLLILVLLLAGCAAKEKDPFEDCTFGSVISIEKKEGITDLILTLARPEKEAFIVNIENHTDKVHTFERYSVFTGTFYVKRKSGEIVEVIDYSYGRLMISSLFFERTIKLNPGEAWHYEVPFHRLSGGKIDDWQSVYCKLSYTKLIDEVTLISNFLLRKPE